MTPFDAIILVIFLAFLARGIWMGLVGQLAFLAALVLGYAAAGIFYGQASQLLLPLIHNPQATFLITCILLFVVAYLLTILVGKGLKKVMEISFLGWFDRTMGGVFGLAKALFVSTLLFIFISGFTAGPRPFFSKALVTPYLSVCSNYLLTWVRDNDLRSRFLPKQAAISSLLTQPVPLSQPAKRKPAKKSH